MQSLHQRPKKNKERDDGEPIYLKLLSAFLQMDYSEELFWNSTPKQFFFYQEAYSKKIKRQNEDQLVMLYGQAMVAASFKTKKPIELPDFLKMFDTQNEANDADDEDEAKAKTFALINHLRRDAVGKKTLTLEEWKIELGIIQPDLSK